VGKEEGTDFMSAYLIEKALSMDNIFVFILVFSFFQVPSRYQHKVLFYGILGAIIFRAIFIFAGLGMIRITYLPEFVLFGHVVHLNGVLTVFGLFLVYAGISTFKKSEKTENDFSKNWIVRFIRSVLPVSNEYDGGKFFTRINGKLMATPLLLVVAVVEGTDILFAVDSIPAIFAITNDPFILYTSNIFAILGLRSLYFLLANFMPMFRFLHYGLAIILTFIGVKMLLTDFVHIPSPVSLSIVAGILVVSVLASVIISQNIDDEKVN
jgi:tellurite resistance protein TerC